MTTITASTVIDGITVSVSAQFSAEVFQYLSAEAEAFCEGGSSPDFRALVAQAVALSLAQAELEVSRSLLAATAPPLSNNLVNG